MSSSSSRPMKRKRKNQNKREDEECEGDSTTTAPIDDSHNVVEKENKKMTSPLVVFAHGARAPSSSDWMIRYLSFRTFIQLCINCGIGVLA